MNPIKSLQKPVLVGTLILISISFHLTSCIKLSGSLNNISALLPGLVRQYKAVTVGAAGTVLYSEDGMSWTRISNFPDAAITLNAVISTGSGFIALGGTSSCKIFYSSDGKTWSTATGTPGCISLPLGFYDAAVGGGRIVAVGENTGVPLIYISTNNGISWTAGSCAACSGAVIKIAFTGSNFVIISKTAASGAAYISLRSADGSSFAQTGFPLGSNTAKANTVPGYLTIGSRVFASGTDTQLPPPTRTSITTDQGTTWNSFTPEVFAGNTITEQPTALAYSGTRLLAVGDNCRVDYTSNTVSLGWTGSNLFMSNCSAVAWKGLVHDGSKFIAVGSSGKLSISATGTNTDWTALTSPTTNQLNGIAVSR